MDVRYLQHVLIELGPSIYPAQRATGNFGPATELGVKNFQKAFNMTQTGKLDADTRSKLNGLIN
jgi:peptidoglycan hydrolase-like protein with peptidoglycan-binding domain